MTDVTLKNVGTGYDLKTTINDNNDKLEAALEKTLNKHGGEANSMSADIDLASAHRVTNAADAVNNQDYVTLAQAAAIVVVDEVLLSSTNIGTVIFPRTDAETAAGIAAYVGTNTMGDIMFPQFEQGDVRRYGANELSLDNSLAFRAAAKQAWKDGSYILGTCGRVFAPAGHTYNVTQDVDFRGVQLDFRAYVSSGTSNAKCYMGGYARGRNPEQYMYNWAATNRDVDVPQIEIWGSKRQEMTINQAFTVYFMASSGDRADTTLYPNFDTLYPDWRFESLSGQHTTVNAVHGSYGDYYNFNYANSYTETHLIDVDNIILKSGDRIKHPDGVLKPTPLPDGNSGYHNELNIYCADFKLFRVEDIPAKQQYTHNGIHVFCGMADSGATDHTIQALDLSLVEGSTQLTVAKTVTAGMEVGDIVGVRLDSTPTIPDYGIMHRTTVAALPTGDRLITMTDPLPSRATAGNDVVTFEDFSGIIDIQRGHSIHIHGIRGEGTDPYTVMFGREATRCTVEFSYTSSYGSYPGQNKRVIDQGFNNLIMNVDQKGYQTYPVATIDSSTLIMDSDTAPTRYGIKGFGGLVTMQDNAGPATVTRVAGKFNVSTYTPLYVSDFIPIHPGAKSTVMASWKGDDEKGLRGFVRLYDKQKNELKSPGYLETDTMTTEVEWILSTGASAGTNEYYLKRKGGDDDPKMCSGLTGVAGTDNIVGAVWRNGVGLVGSDNTGIYTVGALADGQWGVGNVNGLSYNTLYVRDNTAAPNTSTNNYHIETEVGVPIGSVDTTGDHVVVTTIYKHGLQTGDFCYGRELLTSAGYTAEPRTNTLLRLQPGYVLEKVDDYNVKCSQTSAHFGTYAGTTGYISRPDISGLGNTWARAGMGPYNLIQRSRFSGVVLRHGAYYAKLYLYTNGGGTLSPPLVFESLNVAVRSPSGNDGQGSWGASASNVPVFNAPDHPPVLTGTATPVGAVTPDFHGQVYVDTTADMPYIATGLLVANWKQAGTVYPLALAYWSYDATRSNTSFGLVLADAKKIIDMGVFSANRTVTLPLNATEAFEIGTEIKLVKRLSGATNSLTIAKADASITIIGDTYTSTQAGITVVLTLLEADTWLSEIWQQDSAVSN